MYSDVMWQSTIDRNAALQRSAERERVARASHGLRQPIAAPRVTLRVDRVWDSVRLHELSKLSGRPLMSDSYVVGEVDGRIVAAVPLAGGRALTDPETETAQLIPLLELRASQIRRVAMRKRGLRMRLHRA